MPKEWYISFHGGEEKSSLNNIHVYSAEGEELRKALNKKSATGTRTPGSTTPLTRCLILKAISMFRVRIRTLLRGITVPPAKKDNRDSRCLFLRSLSPTPACR